MIAAPHQTKAPPQRGFRVIDTDIHLGLDKHQIEEYLPEPWRIRYRRGNRGAGNYDLPIAIHLGTTPLLERPPSEIIREHVLLFIQPIEEPENPMHLHAMLEMFDAALMLIFATDFPYWNGDPPEFTARMLPKYLHTRVMVDNARDLYKLPSS